MWMPRIVMFEPTRQPSHPRLCIGPMSKIGIVALERSHEALSHAVALRTAHPGRYPLQPQFLSKQTRLRRRVAAAIVGQPFHLPDSLAIGTEALLDCLHHQVADQVSIATLDCGHPTHRFAVTAVQCKRNPHTFAVIAAEPKPIRTPASVAGVDCNPTIMPSIRHPLVTTAMKQQLVISHDSVNALVVRLTQASCCSGVQRLRRCTPAMISIFELPPDDVSISIVVFLSVSLRDTDGTVF